MNPLATGQNTAMPAPAPRLAPGIAQKINALHADVQRMEKESRRKLNGAAAAAWQAGKLLLEAKASIVRHGGRGAWTPWIKTMFAGDMRTAQRYMKFARELSAFNPATADAMSLRQLYFRLGIATEPKQSASTRTQCVGRVPQYIALANKLPRALRSSQKNIQSRDLAALYIQLRALFEPGAEPREPALVCTQK